MAQNILKSHFKKKKAKNGPHGAAAEKRERDLY
jgi:hypothetical protein